MYLIENKEVYIHKFIRNNITEFTFNVGKTHYYRETNNINDILDMILKSELTEATKRQLNKLKSEIQLKLF